MIKLPRLSLKDLEIFKGKKVIVYGNIHPVNLFRIFKCLNIEVVGFVPNELSTQTKLKSAYLGLKILKAKDLNKLKDKYSNIIVQISSSDPAEIEKNKKIADNLGFECSNLSSGEIASSFSYMLVSKELKNPFIYRYQRIKREHFLGRKSTPELKEFLEEKAENSIIICSATKTADHSLLYTFNALKDELEHCDHHHQSFSYINLWHRPQYIDKSGFERELGKVKIVMGVRDPIAQNISHLYQWISKGTVLSNCIFPTFETNLDIKRDEIIKEFEELFKNYGDDFQALWEMYVKLYMNSDENVPSNLDHVGFIQLFIPMVQSYIMDILAKPFDKEKGYAIMKEGNTEVFIYQLEKLNSVIPQLSNWVGLPFDKLQNGNEASSKWIGESYKQAGQELELSKEYVEKCYNSPFVKHFYSESDIDKFKAKWSTHIKK
ncbi:MAG: putative capsular polysaccharide synthesis family protein [Clostridia bacterium]